jgi:hypothetical protein
MYHISDHNVSIMAIHSLEREEQNVGVVVAALAKVQA